MKHLMIIMAALLLFSANAFAQEEAATEPAAATEAAPAEQAPEEEKRGPYYKKVQGWLWLEGFVGPSSSDPRSVRKSQPQ